MRRICCLAIAAWAVPATAAAQPSGSQLNLARETGCRALTPGEVVVCGERGASPYRIDPTILEAMRQKERAANPPRPPERSAGAETCAVGPQACPGEGAVDFVRPAMLIVAAAVKALQGEDWREPFRTKPDDYQVYQDSKSAAEGP
jgi:hypothetical protein